MKAEERMEQLLEEHLPELPPEDIVQTVTPWRRAMNRVITGLVLHMVTLRFLWLQYILPLAGSILLVLGFRTLRQENRWLKTCWWLSLPMLGVQLLSLWSNAVVWLGREDVLRWLALGNMVMQMAQLLCLWQGLRTVQRRAGLPEGAGAAGALQLWYGILCVLALTTSISGWAAVLTLLVPYVFIVRSLHRLAGTMEEAGYAMQPAPPRYSDGAVAGCVLGVLALGLGLCFLLGGKYSMDWQPREAVEAAEAREIAAQLAELGFPETVLSDLSEDALMLCAGAQEVVVQRETYPLNDGRPVTVRQEDGLLHTRVYDVHELELTHIGVKLAGERVRWRIFHAFSLTEDADFPGTEAIQLWTAGRSSEGWMDAYPVTGRVLCSREGQEQVSDYAWLGRRDYTSQSLFWGESLNSDIFAAFSFPRQGEHCRGYLTYEIVQQDAGWLVDSWVNYVHQTSPWHYPVLDAMEARIQGKTGERRAFRLVQSALQFNPMYPQETLE